MSPRPPRPGGAPPAPRPELESPMATTDDYARGPGARPAPTTATADHGRVVVNPGDDPSQPHEHYAAEKTRRDLVRLLWDGTEAVRAAGEDALRRYETESDDDYETRSTLAGVHPGLGEAAEVTVGLLTMQEPTFAPDMDEDLVQFWENVDGRGNHGAVFSTNLLTDGILDGAVGIFTEMARVDRTRIDAAEARRLGLRPWWILVHADDTILPIYEPVNGVERLVLFVRREIVVRRIPDTPFGRETVVKYHVYEDLNGTITARTYEAPDTASRPMLVPDSEVTLEKQREIPWAPLETGRRLSDGSLSPPFLELAHLILEHHEIKTGRMSLSRKGFAPTLVIINMPPNADGSNADVETGPGSVIHARFASGEQIPQNPVYYASPPMEVMEPSERLLENTENAIVVAGGRHLAPDKKGVEAAKSKQIDNRSRNASISRIARRWQDCLERAYQHVAAYMGKGALNAGSVAVSMRFEEALMEPDVMNAYGKLLELGLPVRLAVRALKMQGRIPADANEDEVVRDWELGLEAAKADRAMQAELARKEQQLPNDPAADGEDDAA